ncbi:MAG TPA: HAMP domain-containing protein, partial [Pseudonocardiaceae bacterium]|nr:HAMP domain-containing protein [Pseudonocardiaceae bacterium]
MTSDRRQLASPLGRRLLAAFVLVALSSVAVLTVAALIGTDRGLASAHRSEREQAASRVAAAAGTAYATARGWPGADLSAASAIADASGARLLVGDAAGTMVWPGRGMGPGMGGMHTDGGGAVVEAPVIVAGQRVGTARLAFPTAANGGRTVAWSWVIGAALVALAAALAVSGYVSRRLTRPLVALAAAARRFAAGDRTARARVNAPG